MFEEIISINNKKMENNKIENIYDSEKDHDEDVNPYSILDMDIKVLESLDIEILKNTFYAEIKALSKFSDKKRELYLKHIVERLFSLQPDSESYNDNHLRYSETRLYIDLISTPGLWNISYFREFLLSSFSLKKIMDYYKKELLLKIFRYYDRHSREEIDKVNYLLKSSDKLTNIFLRQKAVFNDWFDSEVLSYFSKEDLSLIYRFFPIGQVETLLKKENRKALFMIGLMTKKVSSNIGHSNEFLNKILLIFGWGKGEKFLLRLGNFYDRFIGEKENEIKFSIDFINNNGYPEILELINNINNDEFGSIGVNDCLTVDDFMNYVSFKRDSYHLSILKMGVLDRIKDGEFDKNYFKKIKDERDLEHFIEAYLFNVYGLEVGVSKRLVKAYGQNLNELEKDILDSDKKTFEILKAISNIVNLSFNSPDFNEKIGLLQREYYQYLVKNGSDYRNKLLSSVVLEGLFNKMYINTYNKRLLRIDGLGVLEEDNGVTILDSGLKFNIMLTSLAGSGTFYNDSLNLKSKWNTSTFSDNLGICMSDITHDNLGVIGLDAPLLGFSYIPDYALNAMGPSDIYSVVEMLDLKSANKKLRAKCYIPGSVISDYTRYGYNEFLVDRFLRDDDKVKLQPDYVVFYKVGDDYKDSEVYRKTLKVAKDFKIPIVLVDVLKIKDNEKKEISFLEEELFSRDKCDSSLMKKIITRYMNNYSGSLVLTSTDDLDYVEDFSVKGMERFFKKIFAKIEGISFEEREEWIKSLEEVYLEEELKYKEAKKIHSYNHSVQDFVLKKYEIVPKIFKLKNNNDSSFHNKKGVIIADYNGLKVKKDGEVLLNRNHVSSDDLDDSVIKVGTPSGEMAIFLRDEDFSIEARTLIDFMGTISEYGYSSTLCVEKGDLNGLNGNLIYLSEAEDDEVSLVENLIVSYFFENTERLLLDDMICYDMDINVKFNSSDDFDFSSSVMASKAYQDVLSADNMKNIPINFGVLDLYLKEIANINNYDLLKMFSPVIEKYSKEHNERFETVAGRILDKKANIRDDFKKLYSTCIGEDSNIRKKN